MSYYSSQLAPSIREHLDAIGEALNTCDEVFGVCRVFDLDDSPKHFFETEILMYWLYLTASDGSIDDDEVDLLNAVFGHGLTAENCKQLIVSNGIYSREFEQRVPLSFFLMAYADEKAKSLGQSIDGVSLLLNSYEKIGEMLINSDGNADASELADLSDYMRMIRNGVPAVKAKVRGMI